MGEDRRSNEESRLEGGVLSVAKTVLGDAYVLLFVTVAWDILVLSVSAAMRRPIVYFGRATSPGSFAVGIPSWALIPVFLYCLYGLWRGRMAAWYVLALACWFFVLPVFTLFGIWLGGGSLPTGAFWIVRYVSIPLNVFQFLLLVKYRSRFD